MAIWQFRFSLVPIAGIVKHHRGMPPALEAYEAANDIDPDRVWPNYWHLAGRSTDEAAELIESLLPRRESWSREALMFGQEHGDSIEIWSDDVACRLDMRNFNRDLLAALIELAADLDCNVIIDGEGRVLDANRYLVEQACEDSLAARFVRDPAGTLRQLGRKRSSDSEQEP